MYVHVGGVDHSRGTHGTHGNLQKKRSIVVAAEGRRKGLYGVVASHKGTFGPTQSPEVPKLGTRRLASMTPLY
jgi:hypothetical protein